MTTTSSSASRRFADRLHDRLLPVRKVHRDGVERSATVNHAMKGCRRAWNVAFRAHPDIVPDVNPFSKMGLEDKRQPTPTATYEELLAFVAACDARRCPSIGTAALIGWEWLQREEDIFGTFEVEHYRPKSHPDAVRHPQKTKAETWFPLFDEERDAAGRPAGRVPLYPALQTRLDEVKRRRIGRLMPVRDWDDRKANRPLPWITDKGDLTFARHQIKEIILAAGLRPELSFRSFRHGGLTEGGDAELTDRELIAQSAHIAPTVLPRHTKRSMRQVASRARKRVASRTKGERLSE